MTKTLMTQSAYADYLGVTRQRVSQLKSLDLLVLENGKVWQEASDQLQAEQKDPAKQGVADYHARQRAGGHTLDDVNGKSGSAYQQARAVKEKYNALAAKMAYEREIGQLLPVDAVKAAVAAGDSLVRGRLETMPDILAPILSAETDEQRIRTIIFDYVEQALSDLSTTFGKIG